MHINLQSLFRKMGIFFNKKQQIANNASATIPFLITLAMHPHPLPLNH